MKIWTKNAKMQLMEDVAAYEITGDYIVAEDDNLTDRVKSIESLNKRILVVPLTLKVELIEDPDKTKEFNKEAFEYDKKMSHLNAYTLPGHIAQKVHAARVENNFITA
jgi:hypothetical protein